MPKTKGKNFPPVRVDDSLYNLTVKCANKADEYLSDYIRKAVEMRNTQLTGENRKPSGIGMDTKETKYVSDEKPKTDKPTVPELKNMVKEMEKVQTFFKGGK